MTDIPNVKECRTGSTVNMSFKRQSSVEDDTQSFNLIRQRNRASIITEEIFDLAILFFEPTRRISVLLLFSYENYLKTNFLIHLGTRTRAGGNFEEGLEDR